MFTEKKIEGPPVWDPKDYKSAYMNAKARSYLGTPEYPWKGQQVLRYKDRSFFPALPENVWNIPGTIPKHKYTIVHNAKWKDCVKEDKERLARLEKENDEMRRQYHQYRRNQSRKSIHRMQSRREHMEYMIGTRDQEMEFEGTLEDLDLRADWPPFSFGSQTRPQSGLFFNELPKVEKKLEVIDYPMPPKWATPQPSYVSNIVMAKEQAWDRVAALMIGANFKQHYDEVHQKHLDVHATQREEMAKRFKQRQNRQKCEDKIGVPHKYRTGGYSKKVQVRPKTQSDSRTFGELEAAMLKRAEAEKEAGVRQTRGPMDLHFRCLRSADFGDLKLNVKDEDDTITVSRNGMDITSYLKQLSLEGVVSDEGVIRPPEVIQQERMDTFDNLDAFEERLGIATKNRTKMNVQNLKTLALNNVKDSNDTKNPLRATLNKFSEMKNQDVIPAERLGEATRPSQSDSNMTVEQKRQQVYHKFKKFGEKLKEEGSIPDSICLEQPKKQIVKGRRGPSAKRNLASA